MSGDRTDLPFQAVVQQVQLYTFAFDNVIGNTTGTATGTVRLDFIQDAIDSGSGPANDVRITSAPSDIPPDTEGNVATLWSTQSLNTFAVSGGNIVDYQFGASEGINPTANDNVLCLNNGPQFAVGGVYICTAGENYYGDGSAQVYNTGGIAAVDFERVVSAGQYAPAARYRFNFDLGADPANSQPPNPANFAYDCVRTEFVFTPSLPAGISLNIELFENSGGGRVGGPTSAGPFPNPISSLGFEVFNISAPIPGGRGYGLIEWSEAIDIQQAVRVRGQVPCGGSTSATGYANGTVTVLP